MAFTSSKWFFAWYDWMTAYLFFWRNEMENDIDTEKNWIVNDVKTAIVTVIGFRKVI